MNHSILVTYSPLLHVSFQGKDVGPPPTRAAWAETQGHPHPYSDSRQAPPGPGMRPFDSRGSPPGPGWAYALPSTRVLTTEGRRASHAPSPSG